MSATEPRPFSSVESVNEPPGSPSNPLPGDEPQPQLPSEGETEQPLPSDSELERMTRADLDELARARGVDVTEAGNKDDVIRLLHKDEKKRKRG